MNKRNGPGIGHNSMPPGNVIRDYTARVESELDDLATARDEHLARTKVIRDKIKNIIEEAAETGISKREFKAVIRTRQLETKADLIREGLKDDEVETFDQIREALGGLGELPLGQAVLEKILTKQRHDPE